MMKHNACGKSECFLEILGVVLIILGTILTLMTHSHAGIFMLFVSGILLCFHKCCLHRKKGMCPGCGCEAEECCCNRRGPMKSTMNPGMNPNPMGKESEPFTPKPPRKPKKDLL
ncbi:MAG: hypothetical protein H2069_05215 [Legionella sp.]|nr:hypothetical protein [Legionella sp.]